MDNDHNLLFGVLALQIELIDSKQFSDACGAWAARKDVPIADILIERGWITRDDKSDVEKLLQRKLRRFGGDVRASLLAAANADVRNAIQDVADSEIRRSLSSYPPAAGHVLIETLMKPAEERSRYTLSRLHGQGGLGKVWIARDSDLNREVALKELRPEQAVRPEAWQRFLKEAQVTGQLEHPNIVPVYELARRSEDDQPFYTMKLVRGQTLAEAIREFHQRRQGFEADALEFRRLLQAYVAVCQALGYAHSRGVVHRDLKPANVVLGGFGEVIVLDWGLAKVAGAAEPEAQTVGISEEAQTDATRTGAQLGTPAYMAPEQAEGRVDQIDGRTDIYGLGTLLFEMLTGRAPHDGSDLPPDQRTTPQLLRRIIHAPTPRARERVLDRTEAVEVAPSGGSAPAAVGRIDPGSIPPALDAICSKAMAKSRDDRYATATDLADDVQRYLADEPVRAHVESLGARTRRWVRKRPTLIGTTAAAALVSLLSLTIIATVVNQSNQSLSAKNQELDRKNRELDDTNIRLAQLNTDLLAANAAERVAKQDAEEKRADAEQARAKTKQAFDFLVGAFRVSDPDAAGETFTVAELFDHAVTHLETAFRDEPLIQAELLNTIGMTYRGLGHYEKAIDVFTRASNLRQVHLGDAHEDTLTSMNHLAVSFEFAGRPAEALPVIEKTLELRQSTLGTEHIDTLTSMSNLANIYRYLGRLPEAIQLQEQAMELRRTVLGPEHPHTILSMSNLALAYRLAGRLDDALPLYERALDLRKSVLGPHHTKTLLSMQNLAIAYRSAGKLADALPLFEQTLELRKAKLGPTHPATVSTMDRLAETYMSAGRRRDALPLYKQTVELNKRRLGAEHPNTLEAIGNLARSYRSLNMFEESIAQFRRLWEARQTTLPPGDRVTVDTENQLGWTLALAGRYAEAETHLLTSYRAIEHAEDVPADWNLAYSERLANLYALWGQPDKAEPWLRRKLELTQKNPRADHAATCAAQNQLALNLLAQHRPADAEALLRDCLATQQNSSADTGMVAHTKSLLGAALAAQKQFPAAESLLLDGYRGLVESQTSSGIAASRVVAAIRRLIDLYTAWGNADAVAKWQAVLEQTQGQPPAKGARE